jgi:mRNA interferase RelE/StbE
LLMSEYEIELTADAKIDLEYYTIFERKIIVSEIRKQLLHEAHVETRNRKILRENPIASWELRIGKFRIFYEITRSTVSIISLGHKEHNLLYIRGEKVKL